MILIFGAPRSGTSWLGKIFDSHPNTLYRAEPDKELRSAEIPYLCTDQDIATYCEATARYAESLMAVHNSNVAGSPPFPRKAFHSDVQYAVRTAVIYGAKSLGRLPGVGGAFGNLNVPDFADFRRSGDVQVVMKSVGSLGRLGLFLAALPAAKVILIIRHPCGHVASVIAGQKSRNLSQNAALAGLGETAPARERGLDQSTLNGLPHVEQLAWRWLILNELALRQSDGNDNVTVLKYEDLCAEPEPMARRLFEFTGLPWSDQTAGFVAESTASRNESGKGYFSVNRDPLISAMKWKTQMEPDDIATVRRVVDNSQPGKLFAQDYD